ncbi:mucin-5AC-like [Argopecten irradians]|uniref:mucin-5AC-like n=1 Tax=Argopecten irradians TaxID=31199 RepID=UPI0037247B92
MDYLYFILVILIFLKVLFWIFYFYARAQRLRASRTTQRNFIVVERTRQTIPVITHDQARIVDNEHPQAYTNQAGPQNFPQPPSYTECVSQTQSDTKPPSYDQVIQGQISVYPGAPYTVSPTTQTVTGQYPATATSTTTPAATATSTAAPVNQTTDPSPNPLYGYNQ